MTPSRVAMLARIDARLLTLAQLAGGMLLEHLEDTEPMADEQVFAYGLRLKALETELRTSTMELAAARVRSQDVQAAYVATSNRRITRADVMREMETS